MKKIIVVSLMSLILCVPGCASNNDEVMNNIMKENAYPIVEEIGSKISDIQTKDFYSKASSFNDLTNTQILLLINMDRYYVSSFKTRAQWGRTSNIDSDMREKAAAYFESTVDSIDSIHTQIMSDYNNIIVPKLKKSEDCEKIMSKIDIMYEDYKKIYSEVMVTGTDPVAMADKITEYASEYLLSQQELLILLGE